MKKLATLALGLSIFVIGAAQGAEKKAPLDKFYGKLVSVTSDGTALTVANKTRKLKSDFQLLPDTKVVLRKKFVPREELAAGQNLIVYYTTEADRKIAQRITIRSRSKTSDKAAAAVK